MKKIVAIGVILCVFLCAILNGCAFDFSDNSLTEEQSNVASEEASPEEPEQPNGGDKVEEVLYDENDIRIVLTGFEKDNLYGWNTLEIRVENNSQYNVVVMAQNTSVDGFMCDLTSGYFEVASGKKTIDDIVFMDDLEELGVEFNNIEFSFKIWDSDTYNTIDETNIYSVTIN